jgi:CHASE2 domain-containing sensor protein
VRSMRRLPELLLAAVLGLLVAGEALFLHGHHFPSFHALVGFASCVAVVVLAKALGRGLLQRPEEEEDA